MEPLSHESVAKVIFLPLSSMLLLLAMITCLSSLSLAEDPLLAAQPPNLEGIWTINLGSEQVTMMIRQHESRLIGACTGSDSGPWNAVVMGSLAGNEVELQARSIRSGSSIIVETAIAGETDGETIRGSFLRGDSQGKVSSGEATGFKINPDTSQYRPAATILADAIAPSSMNTETIDESREKAEDQQATGADKGRFVDVKSQTDRVFYLGWAWTPGEASDKAAAKNPI